jgi:hypothetical protein
MERKEFYLNHIDALTADIAVLKQRNRFFVAGEIITFLAALGFVVLYTVIHDAAWTLGVAALIFIVYVLIRRMDVRNGSAIDDLTDLRSAYQHEVSYLEGDYSCFSDGERYLDPHHPFTFDLDIFGRDSLFNRMNRTITSGGSDRLAEYLSFASVSDQSDAIDILAADETWRTKFISLGQRQQIDTNSILVALNDAGKTKITSAAGSGVMFVVAWLLIVGFFASVALSICGLVSSNLPVWWGILQFFGVFSLTSRSLKTITKTVGSLHGQMKQYIGMVRHCQMLTNVPASLKSQIDSLDEAMLSFERLEDVLDGLDRRGNMLGLFFFDAFFLSDFFLIRKFLKWQGCYLDKISAWIDVVSHVDALVSMATFRYNHPEAGHAEIVESDEIIYEARDLYHPFLGAGAVRNDFSILDGNYYIITGANMAGKSTFLRSVGVNYILARNGMPVFASSLRVSRFSLFSSMRTTDDLTHGISYFNAELLRLKQLIDHCSHSARTLIILDEILKGTNSLDKLNGSRLFLQSISRMPVSGVIATHDLELSKMADEYPDRFHNYCFEIELGADVTYSYKITLGVARNQNATFLLKNILRSV